MSVEWLFHVFFSFFFFYYYLKKASCSFSWPTQALNLQNTLRTAVPLATVPKQTHKKTTTPKLCCVIFKSSGWTKKKPQQGSVIFGQPPPFAGKVVWKLFVSSFFPLCLCLCVCRSVRQSRRPSKASVVCEHVHVRKTECRVYFDFEFSRKTFATVMLRHWRSFKVKWLSFWWERQRLTSSHGRD